MSRVRSGLRRAACPGASPASTVAWLLAVAVAVALSGGAARADEPASSEVAATGATSPAAGTAVAMTGEAQAAPPDTARGGGLSALARKAGATAPDSTGMAAMDSAAAAAAAAAAPQPWLLSWARTPKVGLLAQVRSVTFSADLENALAFRGQRTVASGLQWTSERYRQQDKTVETRDGNISFSDPQGHPFASMLRLAESWSEDRTVNTVGNANVNKRDFKQATASFDSMAVWTAGVRHALRVDGAYNDQKGSSLGQRNDYSEGTVGAGLRSRYLPAEGLAVNTVAYGAATGGRHALGEQSNPSSSNGDSLGARVGYGRGPLTGSFSVKQSSFAKKYLDFRRNANGMIDTTGVAEKIVQELERNRALTMEWKGGWQAGHFRLDTSANHDFGRDTYRASFAGLKERLRDAFEVRVGWAVWDDSLAVDYGYTWSWDDQTYKGAAAARGRQIAKRREVGVNWTRDLFTHTQLQVDWQTSLQQSIAEGQFNENDRDSYQSNVTAGISSNWRTGFKTTMSLVSRHAEDIAIRRSRSANNNVQDTYEIVPAYSWNPAEWLLVQQNFRLSIQYTNYVFAGFSAVSQPDNYNKRGNLNTKVTLHPDKTLAITVSNDYNGRFNASRVSTDAAGNDTYSRDLQQRISTIDLGISWQATPALKLEGATARTKDVRDTFGDRAATVDQRSGEVWVGGTFDKEWGSRKLSASVRKHSAFGPNVQQVNADYWDADINLTWGF